MTLNHSDSVLAALIELKETDRTWKHQLCIEALAHCRVLRERGNKLGVYAVLYSAVTQKGIKALDRELGKAKAALVCEYGEEVTDVIANRIALAVARLGTYDVNLLAKNVHGAIPQWESPVAKAA